MRPQHPAPELAETWSPLVFSPREPSDLASLLRRAHREGWRVYDTLESQLQELLRVRDPGRAWDDSTRSAAVAEHLGGRDPGTTGTWVYYPWSNCLVHILERKQYRELRLSRNRNKIDVQSQERLLAARVGVVGLSVGFSIAQTLVLEGVGGELRLADHDSLCLSNLNRVPCGNAQIGLNKAVAAARRILEIDPYLSVAVYTDGLTEENTVHFLKDGGTLDLVMEECDDLATKVRVRREARSCGAPVIMDTNDRGMLDVERFDLEPGRPLLHGLLEGLGDPGALSPPERIELVRELLGRDAMSRPLADSLEQIGVTLASWPQLGSGTTSGAGMVVDVARRILLGQLHASGRFYADPEQLVHD